MSQAWFRGGADRSGLSGCPVGGWPETRQAMQQLADALPPRDERDWTIGDLVEAAYEVVGGDARSCGRYALRDDAEARIMAWPVRA